MERDSFAKPEMGARVTKEEPGKVTSLKGEHSASRLCSQHEGSTSSAQDYHTFQADLNCQMRPPTQRLAVKSDSWLAEAIIPKGMGATEDS